MNGTHVLMFVAGMLLHVACGLFAAFLLNSRTEFPKPDASLFLSRGGETPHCVNPENLNEKGGVS